MVEIWFVISRLIWPYSQKVTEGRESISCKDFGCVPARPYEEEWSHSPSYGHTSLKRLSIKNAFTLMNRLTMSQRCGLF